MSHHGEPAAFTKTGIICTYKVPDSPISLDNSDQHAPYIISAFQKISDDPRSPLLGSKVPEKEAAGFRHFNRRWGLIFGLK